MPGSGLDFPCGAIYTTHLCVISSIKRHMGAYATDRIAAGLMDDDPVGEGLIMGLNVKCPLLSVQRVFLDEVDIVHTCNLQTTHNSNSCYKTLN